MDDDDELDWGDDGPPSPDRFGRPAGMRTTRAGPRGTDATTTGGGNVDRSESRSGCLPIAPQNFGKLPPKCGAEDRVRRELEEGGSTPPEIIDVFLCNVTL